MEETKFTIEEMILENAEASNRMLARFSNEEFKLLQLCLNNSEIGHIDYLENAKIHLIALQVDEDQAPKKLQDTNRVQALRNVERYLNSLEKEYSIRVSEMLDIEGRTRINKETIQDLGVGFGFSDAEVRSLLIMNNVI